MKIALYYPWIYLKSGVERTILETVKGSKNEYTIFTNHYDQKGTFPEFGKLNVIELKKVPVRRDIFSTLKAAITISFQKIDLTSFDLFVVHSEGLGDLILFKNYKIPTICFCDTPLRPVFDIEYKKRAMKKRSIFNRFMYLFFSYIFIAVDRYLWEKYKYIIFSGKETLKRAKQGNLLNANSNYEIVHRGVSWDHIKPTGEYEKYFLVPGRIMWTKNIELAIEAFKKFSLVRTDFKLIIAGMVDKKSVPYYKTLKNLSGGRKNIKFVINPSDKEMFRLYENCYTAITTSFNEDWGLTPIEANAYGKPVLAVNMGGFKESQVNGKTGFLLNNNPKEFAAKMLMLAKNKSLVRKMGDYARTHSKQFSWNKFVSVFDTRVRAFPDCNNYSRSFPKTQLH
ncbi:MAG TPA: glycosyltransferase [Candidatus Saccharimonadales bacterium]|jgi:glycosyltransferase involved in cell wall biosynthesis|nr:glycosyltransferase [Candidatus Saccharimonadales bacterium]